ncbi:unnamed protein product [[Candida] boidinii]|uniref:Unnamed protein product n=1 Tax=Candida boidinii TaxID=5477 RepID=A0A9W6T4U2_CANBO|nr:hypothetical protein B5S30_g5179 [[Candida] boidinii]OWB86178.1 hypothetical protein B5S33_g4860 [[Candida] boidinii]GME72643.1 unnamed protein product [[Candida] boidinii]
MSVYIYGAKRRRSSFLEIKRRNYLSERNSSLNRKPQLNLQSSSNQQKLPEFFRLYNNKLVFESLPDNIVNLILDQLDIQTLLNLSYVCKKFNKLITKRIYKEIKFLSNVSKYNNNNIFNKDYLNINMLNVYDSGIVINKLENFLKFQFNLIINNSQTTRYCDLIESVKFGEISRIFTKDNQFWKLKLIDFYTLEEINEISQVIKYSNNMIDSYDIKELTIFQIFSDFLIRDLNNLERLVVPSVHINQMVTILKRLPNLSKLQELSITITSEFDDYGNECDYSILSALELKKLTILMDKKVTRLEINNILQKFNFSRLDTLSIHIVNSNDDFDLKKSSDNWIEIFKMIKTSQVKGNRLILNSLELINLDLSDKQIEVSQLIHETIDLNNLQELKLNIYEKLHIGDNHHVDCPDDKMKTLLELLIPFLNNLQKLLVKPTKNCFECQFDFCENYLFDSVLNHRFYDNLRELNFEFNNYNQKDEINKIIIKLINNFRSLQKLSINNFNFINLRLNESTDYFKEIQNFFKFENANEFQMINELNEFTKSRYLSNNFITKLNQSNTEEFKFNFKLFIINKFINELKLFNGIQDNNSNQIEQINLFGMIFKINKFKKLISVLINDKFEELYYFN